MMSGSGARPPTVFFSAGEPSGDLHGAEVAAALRARIPGVRMIGFGGRRMRAEGVETIADVADLAVIGLAEVVKRIPYYLRLEREVDRIFRSGGVDLLLPIDFPGFNLRISRRARRRGLSVLYYVAPQVWAWKRGRVRAMARDIDRLAVILPFEESLFRDAGVRADFVGHPLLDEEVETPDLFDWAEAVGVDPGRPILALFPGSRAQELDRHGAVFDAAARLVTERRPDVQPVVGIHPDVPEALYAGLGWPRAEGRGGLLRHATAAIVKSGTGTLETALAGTPFVVAYRTHPITFTLARRIVKVPHVALANLVAERRVVPELLQDDATPAAIADAVLPLLDPVSPARRRIVDELGRIRAKLGSRGAAGRVADHAAEMLSRSP